MEDRTDIFANFTAEKSCTAILHALKTRVKNALKNTSL